MIPKWVLCSYVMKESLWKSDGYQTFCVKVRIFPHRILQSLQESHILHKLYPNRMHLTQWVRYLQMITKPPINF